MGACGRRPFCVDGKCLCYDSTMSLTDLPLEILEHVVDYIDEAPDLLHFALVNKQFSQFIITSHLQFRVIRCLTNTTLIWSKMVNRPDLCARIREIHLYGRSYDNSPNPFYPRKPILPASLQDHDWDLNALWPQIETVVISSYGEKNLPNDETPVSPLTKQTP